MARSLAPRPRRPRRRKQSSAQSEPDEKASLASRVLDLAKCSRGELEGASPNELCREWRQLYRSEPPRISRDLLIRGLGYRLQEIQHGGLGKSTRRKLKTLAKMFQTTGRVAPDPGLSLKPGARLVREWQGRTHTVTVTEDGFEYAGMSYPSLTKVARKITGAHWSGPRFFGLVRAGAQRISDGDGDG